MNCDLLIHNNKLISRQQIVVGIGNRSFRYGDGLFESIRIANGKIMFPDLHVQRLQRGFSLLKMNPPEILTNAELLTQQIKRLMAIYPDLRNGRVRITAYRNDGGMYAPDNNDVSYIIEAATIEMDGFRMNQKGLKADVFEEMVKPIHPLWSVKTTSSAIYAVAGVFKNQNQLDDVILMNEKGNLCEALTSNLFIVEDKTIITPPLSDGCLDGVMRRVIMEKINTGVYTIKEESITKKDLLAAGEAFITNATYGIRYLVGYKEKRYYTKAANYLSEELNLLILNQ